MPFPNFHSARMIDPKKFTKIVQLKELPNGIRLIGGRLKGETTTTVQAYRFPKEKFTVTQAREWLKKEKLKPILFEPAKEKKGDDSKYIENVSIIDVMDNVKDFHSIPFKTNEDGFLEGMAPVTNVGIFTYKMKTPDGKTQIIRELRPPEEVFDPESLQTLQMIPLTNGHPKNLVDMENIKKLQTGFTGDTVRTDSYAVSVPMKFTDKQAIEDVKSGKLALSCGYTADLEFTPGTLLGVDYDAIQRNIRYNHIALVDRGRAGDLAKMELRMDSYDAFMIKDDSSVTGKEKNKNKGDNMPDLKKIILDGVEYEAEAKVIEALNIAKKDIGNKDKEIETKQIEIDNLNKEKSKIEAERDTHKDELDKVKKELEENKMSDEDIKKAVDERLGIIQNAKNAELEVKDEMTNTELKTATVLKLFPNAKLEDKNEDYIDARYDSAIELLNKELETKKDKENKKKVFGDKFQNKNPQKTSFRNKKREDYIKRLEDAYKNPTSAVSAK